MIKYSLNCEFLHTFEAWFSDSVSFERQCELNLVSCPECGNSKIKRALMTPNLSAGNYKEQQNQASESASKEVTDSKERVGNELGYSETSNITEKPNLTSDKRINSVQVITMLRNIRSYFEKNGRNVGNKFAEEALKIHYGEKEPSLIYGTCTSEEGEQLVDEGVEFAELPSLPKDN